ncbi:MAG: hypothetical protein KDD45_12150 [Bdellovibrionales bacterium]|nr:hypothetical protein [Bdellovibrionales bacterium]
MLGSNAPKESLSVTAANREGLGGICKPLGCLTIYDDFNAGKADNYLLLHNINIIQIS